MYQLKIGTIPLPKLYVCDNRIEASECRKRGVPYIIKPDSWDDLKLVKAVLWRTLHDKFPYIKWYEILKMNAREVLQLKLNVPNVVYDEDEWTPKQGEQVKVSSSTRFNPECEIDGLSSEAMEVTDDGEYRETGGGFDPEDHHDFHIEWKKSKLDDYIGDLGWYVNIDELQALHLLPTFLDDIANAIKINLMDTMWDDGWNKKLGCNMGHWQGSTQAPNLIILDTSGSIPSGVAGTMVSLIETLRHQCNADLIITSRRTEYWAANEELPSPDSLAYIIGGCNECVQFYAILRKYILGKHWGNLIIFGDQDSPLREDIQDSVRGGVTTNISASELQNTRIDRIMAFHTYAEKVPGYGLWAVDASPKADVVYNTDWVKGMRDY